MAFDHDAAKRSVLAVGPGRGFVVETNDDLLVMTAAHCLPRLPEPGPPDVNQLTILNLIGALGGDLTVAAECRFVDPVSDLAVLGIPDRDQGLLDESRKYKALVGEATALPVADMRGELGELVGGWLLSLAGVWFKCKVSHYGGGLFC